MGVNKLNIWGSLRERYETTVHRKILSLDGGGIRGVIAIEILQKIENMLKEKLRKDDDFRLCDYFDYIGGNSTGAIIAAGLAIGLSIKELLDFYLNYVVKVFKKNRFLGRLRSKYSAAPLKKILQETFKNKLYPEYLKCLLLIVTKNESTDSPWPISSNPKAKYNDLDRSDCNLKIPLWQLVRASTSAPYFFPPEVVELDPKDPKKRFVFVDGAMTPYNNPSFLLYKMATLPQYNLEWETGEDKLLLISVGTGSAPVVGPSVKQANRMLWSTFKDIPVGWLNGVSTDQDINCRTIGRCVYGRPIDRELRDMIPTDDKGKIPLSKNLKRDFLYARYDPDIGIESLSELYDSRKTVKGVQKMDGVKYIEEMRQIGKKAAEEVCPEHFGSFI